jgi:hypothetical protein
MSSTLRIKTLCYLTKWCLPTAKFPNQEQDIVLLVEAIGTNSEVFYFEDQNTLLFTNVMLPNSKISYLEEQNILLLAEAMSSES